MAKRKVIRLMEAKDLFEVPDARKEFEKHSTYGDYFFFVIEDEKEEIIGYLIAQKDGTKVIIRKLEVDDTVEDKELYKNTAVSNLYHYVKDIKNPAGKRTCYNVCM